MVRYEKDVILQLADRPRETGTYIRSAPPWAYKKGGGGVLSEKQTEQTKKFSEVATACWKGVNEKIPKGTRDKGNERVELANSCISAGLKQKSEKPAEVQTQEKRIKDLSAITNSCTTEAKKISEDKKLPALLQCIEREVKSTKIEL